MRVDLIISILLNSVSVILNVLVTKYYLECFLSKDRKEATYQQLTVHILAILLSLACILTTINRIDSLTWSISQVFQISYFISAIIYYSTIMTALSFLDLQSNKNRLNWLTSRLTGKFYKDVAIVVCFVIFILFLGRFVILFKSKPDSWMSVWYAMSEFGSILFYFVSLCVAVDVALKITNVSRQTRMHESTLLLVILIIEIEKQDIHIAAGIFYLVFVDCCYWISLYLFKVYETHS